MKVKEHMEQLEAMLTDEALLTGLTSETATKMFEDKIEPVLRFLTTHSVKVILQACETFPAVNMKQKATFMILGTLQCLKIEMSTIGEYARLRENMHPVVVTEDTEVAPAKPVAATVEDAAEVSSMVH